MRYALTGPLVPSSILTLTAILFAAPQRFRKASRSTPLFGGVCSHHQQSENRSGSTGPRGLGFSSVGTVKGKHQFVRVELV